MDGFGERPDWIEIRNIGDAAGNLAGYHLTDDSNDLDKWTFPSTPLNAGAYLVVFASGKDTTDPQGRRHTNFSLSGDGEYVALTNAALAVISEYGANGQNYPKQKVDVSYGIASNGNPRDMLLATAGTLNAAGLVGLVGDTSFSHDRGFYDQPFQLTIFTNTPGRRFATRWTAARPRRPPARFTAHRSRSIRRRRSAPQHFAPIWCRRTWTHRPTYLLTM